MGPEMTSTRIVPFLFDGEITVRVIEREGAPWFVAADVCRALGTLNAADATRQLDEDEKGIDSADTLGGHQEMVVVSESGLYALIFKSRKPHAVRFRKWITAEVLPSLRTTGAYFMAPVSGEAVGLRSKPWEEWSLAERRIAVSEINTARHVFNQGAAIWMWSRLGLPMPPRHLLPAWWQGELMIQNSAQAPN
jgi:prophage antirepressor-like protein